MVSRSVGRSLTLSVVLVFQNWYLYDNIVHNNTIFLKSSLKLKYNDRRSESTAIQNYTCEVDLPVSSAFVAHSTHVEKAWEERA